MSAPPESTPPPDDDADLIRWLANRDAACPMCGYNLHALTLARCPECGEHLQISLSPVDPRMAPWIFLLVSVSAAAGIGFFYLIGITLGGDWSSARYPLYILFAMIPMAILVVCTRRLFQRKLNRAAQWTFAIVAALVVIATLFAFIADPAW